MYKLMSKLYENLENDWGKAKDAAMYFLAGIVILWIIGMVITWFASLPNTFVGILSGGNLKNHAKIPGVAMFFFNGASLAIIAYFVFGLITFMKPIDVILSTAAIIVFEVAAYMILACVTAMVLVIGIVAAFAIAIFGILGIALILLLSCLLGISIVIIPALSVLVIGASLGLSMGIIAPIAVVTGILCLVFKVDGKRNLFSALVAVVMTIGFAWPALTFFFNFQGMVPNRYGVIARNRLVQKFNNDEKEVLRYRIKDDGFYKGFIQTGENANISASVPGRGGASVIESRGWKETFFDGESIFYCRDLTYGSSDTFLAASDGDDVFFKEDAGKIYHIPVYAEMGDAVVVLLNGDVTTIYGNKLIYYLDNDGNYAVDRKTTWYKDYSAMTDFEKMDAIYDILVRQSVEDGEEFTAEEVGWVAYAQASGLLITYLEENGTAYFGRHEDDKLCIYTIGPDRQREKLVEANWSYQGIGTGFFAIDNYLYYCDEKLVKRLNLTDIEDWIYYGRVFEKDDDILTQAFNYSRVEDELVFLYTGTDGITYYSFTYGAKGYRVLDEDEKLLGVLAAKDMLHFYTDDSAGTLSERIQDLLKNMIARTYHTNPTQGLMDLEPNLLP